MAAQRTTGTGHVLRVVGPADTAENKASAARVEQFGDVLRTLVTATQEEDDEDVPVPVDPGYRPKPSVPSLDRNEAIVLIRAALKRRSGKAWSVRGGSGSSWGFIWVSAPPRRMVDGEMTTADRTELADLFGLRLADVGSQSGVSISPGSDYRNEYVARAEGRTPEVYGSPIWD
jgi:hypothetical protein